MATNSYPLIDDVNVVYRKVLWSSSPWPVRIAVHDGVKETILPASWDVDSVPYAPYTTAGGYVLYLVPDATNVAQVWRYHGGVSEQVTFFGESSSIEAAGPDGTVVFRAGYHKRYRASPGGVPEEVGSSLGRVVVRDGKFFVLLGNAVLEVVP